MTEKETLIARLNELGAQLNREVNTSGTIQELKMRIAELEEELGEAVVTVDGAGGDLNHSGITDTTDTTDTIITDGVDHSISQILQNAAAATTTTVTTGDRVSVETLATLHIDALHATRNESVSIVEPGVIVRVSGEDAALLIAHGLAREV
jgi:hypothetical protein